MTIRQKISRSPISMAVWISILMLGAVVVLVIAIGGSYYLTLHQIHIDDARHAAFLAGQRLQQMRAAVPDCKAFQALAAVHAGNDLTKNPHLPSTGELLVKEIRQVYLNSGCPGILKKFG